MIEEEYLEHFGVLGMHWGHTKRQDIPSQKSAHRVSLEAKYLKKGVSNDSAEQMAAKRIRTEKFVAGVLVAAAVTAVSYTAYREIGKRYVGVMLSEGKDLHYVNALGSKATYDRRLYTSFEKGDTKKYKGLLATALRRNKANTTIFDTVLRTTEKIKAPSQQEAAKLYGNFLGEKTNFNHYKGFNKQLVNGVTDPSVKGFVDFLKTKGYNSVLDANDQFISGYSTKKPLILFNAAASTKKLTDTIVEKHVSDHLNTIQNIQFNLKGLAPIVGLGAAFVGGAKAINTSQQYGAVNKYFKENPNSKLSYGQVYNALILTTSKAGVDTYKLKGA